MAYANVMLSAGTVPSQMYSPNTSLGGGYAMLGCVLPRADVWHRHVATSFVLQPCHTIRFCSQLSFG